MDTQTNNDSAVQSEIDETLRQLPDNTAALAMAQGRNANNILALAESIVSETRSRLGENTSKPRVIDVIELFTEHAGQAPEVPEKLSHELRQPNRAEQVANLDGDWDKAYASAVNTFDKTSIEAGSKVQEAVDNWRLAVRIYESEARNAAAIFKADIEKAHLMTGTKGGTHPFLDEHVDYYEQSSAIGTGLVQYESSISQATSELASALGELIQELFNSSASLTVGEATFIDESQKASQSFWAGVQSEFDSRT